MGRDGIGRSLYVAASGRRLLILRSFIKKTQKTPRMEIEIALKRLSEVE
jgi:phage-related protein